MDDNNLSTAHAIQYISLMIKNNEELELDALLRIEKHFKVSSLWKLSQMSGFFSSNKKYHKSPVVNLYKKFRSSTEEEVNLISENISPNIAEDVIVFGLYLKKEYVGFKA